MAKQVNLQNIKVGKSYNIDRLYDLCSKAAEIECIYYDTFMNSITSEDVIEVKGGELRFCKVRKNYLKLIYKYEDDDEELTEDDVEDIAYLGEEDFLRRLEEGEFDDSSMYTNF